MSISTKNSRKKQLKKKLKKEQKLTESMMAEVVSMVRNGEQHSQDEINFAVLDWVHQLRFAEALANEVAGYPGRVHPLPDLGEMTSGKDISNMDKTGLIRRVFGSDEFKTAWEFVRMHSNVSQVTDLGPVGFY